MPAKVDNGYPMRVLKAVGISLSVLIVVTAAVFISTATWGAIKDEIASEVNTRLTTVENNVAALTGAVQEGNRIQLHILNVLDLREALVDDDYDDPLLRPR